MSSGKPKSGWRKQNEEEEREKRRPAKRARQEERLMFLAIGQGYLHPANACELTRSSTSGPESPPYACQACVLFKMRLGVSGNRHVRVAATLMNELTGVTG